jgi:tetratricopeptide (TPR) repeat protein
MSAHRPAENKRAFISHSSADDRYVQEMVQYLRKLGYSEVFNDSHTIEPDEPFWPRIEKGIRECDAFVVVLSHDSVKSDWVDKEVVFARGIGKTVIPLRIDDCTLPASFDGRDVVELRQGRGEKVKIAPSRILRHAPAILFGRERELAALDAAWNERRINLYTLVAWGGVGKTSLVAHWVAERLMKLGWPGVERYFDWSFYSQGTGESRQTSADLFISEALQFFGDADPTFGSPWERGERLAGLVRKHRTLLVLDGIEPLQYPPTDRAGLAGRLKDPALEALVQSLAADNPGLCLVTTREHLKNVEALPTTEEQKLDQLLKEAAIALLRHLQIVGTDEELAAAWKEAGGHALTLQLLGRFIADAYEDRDIRHYRQVHFAAADRERQGRSAFKVMIAYEKWLASAGPERQRELAILRLTGLFDRPISADCLEALRAAPAIPGLTESLVKLKETEWNVALRRLVDVDLLSRSGTGADAAIDAHPLVREYFAEQLQQDAAEAFRAAHSRLFDHLCQTTPHRPDTLAELGPLYQAVVHGCLAGRQQEACENVYRDRILRGTGSGGFYSTRKLGAIGADLGAVAAFFDEPWNRLSSNLSAPDQAWLFNQAATRLQALGRLTEAVELMRVGMDRRVATEDWKNAAISASNLSELEVTLGRLDEGVADARRAVELADRSGDAFVKMGFRTTAADALHQAGERAEAKGLFAEAERMQAERQPEFPLLYSLGGFRYVDLLLVPAERAAWQALLRGTGCQPVKGSTGDVPDAPVAACADAERRAEKWFEWRMPSDSLLDIALDHLSLARARLYRALLSAAPQSEIANLQSEIRTTLDRLRQANQVDHLPKALLTAALYFGSLAEQPDEARRCLDEAQQIAERGPMPLYLADIHLHRARLFRDKTELALARTLIEKHGYRRRKEELEDAETALCS